VGGTGGGRLGAGDVERDGGGAGQGGEEERQLVVHPGLSDKIDFFDSLG
jgi:hypothetical protein